MSVGRIDVMDTCACCGKLAVIVIDRIYGEGLCYPCSRIIYRLRSGSDVRVEDLARAERVKAFIDRKTAEEFRVPEGREAK